MLVADALQRRWEALSLPLAEQATDIKELKDVVQRFRHTERSESYPTIDLIRKKWEEQLEGGFEQAQTIGDLKQLFSDAPKIGAVIATNGYWSNDGGFFSRVTGAKLKILRTWRERFQTEFEAAESTTRRLTLIDEAPCDDGYYGRDEGFLKTLTLREVVKGAKDLSELECVEKYIKSKYYRDHSSFLPNLIKKRREELATT